MHRFSRTRTTVYNTRAHQNLPSVVKSPSQNIPNVSHWQMNSPKGSRRPCYIIYEPRTESRPCIFPLDEQGFPIFSQARQTTHITPVREVVDPDHAYGRAPLNLPELGQMVPQFVPDAIVSSGVSSPRSPTARTRKSPAVPKRLTKAVMQQLEAVHGHPGIEHDEPMALFGDRNDAQGRAEIPEDERMIFSMSPSNPFATIAAENLLGI